jgi:predicted DNA-binding protein (UPF0251 family)
MPRPTQVRFVKATSKIRGLKPLGIPMTELEILTLQLDEFETLRLADREGLYHEEAAERMGVARVTFGRILLRARAKVAEALVEGKALVVGDGPVELQKRQDDACPIHGGPRRRGRACRCDDAPSDGPPKDTRRGPQTA